jgi:hypothetical protein
VGRLAHILAASTILAVASANSLAADSSRFCSGSDRVGVGEERERGKKKGGKKNKTRLKSYFLKIRFCS